MSTTAGSGHLRVAVASDQSLVADAVAMALESRGFAATTLRWPGSTGTSRAPRPRHRYDAGVLISDLDRWSRIRAAGLLLSGVATRWLVLTGAPHGPLWGAVLDAGAEVVVPSSLGVDEIADLTDRIAQDGWPAPEPWRLRLVDEWHELHEQRAQLVERFSALTPREREVLGLLHDGEMVADIAGLLEITEATVRSQVKSILRKLGVNNQLGAVAVQQVVRNPDMVLDTRAPRPVEPDVPRAAP
jgi:DNA-binding NarL/FixJ family response regulator